MSSGHHPAVRVIDGRRMQCKDIPDEVFLDAVRRTPGCGGRPGGWRLRWRVQEELEAVVGPVPEKLFLAKARGLMRRGLLGGCPCGCRGDYHPAVDCEAPGLCCRRRPVVDGVAYVVSVVGQPEADVTVRPAARLTRLSIWERPPREPAQLGTMVSSMPVLPLPDASRPVFTGCLAYLGGQEPR